MVLLVAIGLITLTVLTACLEPKVEYLLSVLYVLLITFIALVSDKLRLGAVLVLVLGAPPFVEYELAVVEVVSRRAVPGIRDTIAYPMFTIIDAALILTLVVAAAKCSLQQRTDKLFRMWPLFAVGILQVIPALVAVLRNLTTPYSGVALTGLSMTISILTVIALAACSLVAGATSKGTLVGLGCGTLLFCAESFYVTWYKYGSISLGGTQFTGLIAGPGATGSLLVLVIPSLFICALGSKGPLRIFMGFTAIIAFAYSILTYSRAVYLGLLVSFFVLSSALKGKTRMHMVKISLLAAMLVMLLVAYTSASLQQKFVSLYSESLQSTFNLESRLVFWKHALWLIQSNPWFGIGPKMWVPNAPNLGWHVHQLYLQYAVEHGLILFSFTTCILATAVFGAFAHTRKLTEQGLRSFYLAIPAGILGFLASQIFESNLGDWRIYTVFWSLMVVMLFRPTNSQDAVAKPAEQVATQAIAEVF
jgi:O-antigen ligase